MSALIAGGYPMTRRKTNRINTLLWINALGRVNTQVRPYNEIKLLFDLQNEIDSVIFNDKKSCQIVICDGSFNPLYNINQ